MPPNTDRLSKAQAIEAKLQQHLSELMSNPEANALDPEITRAQSTLDRVRHEISNQNQSARQTTDTGHLTQDAPASGSPNHVGSEQDYTLFYEPSVEDVKNRLKTDPDLSNRLNLRSWTSSPDQLESLDKNSTAYTTVADEDYAKAAAEAQSRGQGLKRYSKIELTKNPFDKILGGALQYLPSVAAGVEKGATGGLGRVAFNAPVASLPSELGSRASAAMPEGMTPEESRKNLQSIQQQENEHPIASGIGQLAGTIMPSSPGNLAAHDIAGLSGYAGRGILGKALTAAGAGAAAANAQGVAEDVTSGATNGQTVDDVLKHAYEAAPLRAGVGATLGGAADLIGQTAGGLVKGARANPRNADLKLLEEAGGNTHVIRGVKAPEDIQQNINKYVEGNTGETGQAEDIAAEKIVPQMRKSLIDQATAEHSKISGQMQEYFKSPEGLQEHSTRPAVEKMVDLMEQGSFKSPLTGKTKAPDPGKVDLLRKELGNIAEAKIMNPQDAQAFADANDGIVMDSGRASNILGKPVGNGRSVVLVPAKMNAEAVTRMEEKIYEKLGFARNAMGKDDPMWKGINEGFKGVRDKFDYPEAGLSNAQKPTQNQSINPEPILSSHPTQNQSIEPISSVSPDATVRPTSSGEGNARAEADANAFEALQQKAIDRYRLGNAKTEMSNDTLGRAGTRLEMNPEQRADYTKGVVDTHKELMAGLGGERAHNAGAQRLLNEFSYADTPPSGTKVPTGTTENLTPEEIQSAPDSLFPGVKNQEGIADKAKLAKENQTPDVGKVKSIVDQTDQNAAKLTPGELDAIHSYTSRKGEKVGTPEWESATRKLTVDNPTEGGVLYHGVRMPQEQIDKILKSKQFSITKPTSTSYNQVIASSMAYSRAKRGEPVIFEMPKVDNGVSLASRRLGIAGTNNEKEILLNNKDFKVSGFHKDDEGNLVIQLEQRPTQLKATLDNGEVVSGFSALRRKQHEAQQALEEASSLTGSNSNENATRRVQAFGRGPGQAERDAALLAEARKLGLENELRQVAGTGAYHRLAARAWGQAGNGMFNRASDVIGMRVDPLLRAAADYPPNPFTAPPNTPAALIQQYLFEKPAKNLLNLTKGQPAVKASGPIEKEYEKRKNHR